MQKFVFTDGTKAALVDNLPEEAWTIHGETQSGNELATLYSNVAFLYRCVDMRANAIASLPWYIMDGDNEVWNHSSQDVPNSLLFAENLPDLLWQSEGALSLGGEAFWLKEMNRVKVRELRWLAPWTIEPVWTEDDGLVRFNRRLKQREIPFGVENIVYLRLPGQHETEPRTSPAQAAMSASGVIYNVDLFAKMFFERGAIKATLLTVAGNPLPEERERLKSWWRRALTSLGNAFSTEVVSADAVTPVVVGEGIESLESGRLLQERREDIATAMGVPHSMIVSSASNFATAKIDRLNFHETTIVPESVIIQRQLNRQLFSELGLRFEFRPHELDVFQEDEKDRANAFQKNVSSGLKKSLVVQMLGIELPAGVELEDLDDPAPVAEPEPEQPPDPPVAAAPDEEPDEDNDTSNEKSVDVAVFKRWWKKRNNPDPSQFNSDILSEADKLAIVAELQEDATGEDAPFLWQSYP